MVDRAAAIVVDAVWHGRPPKTADDGDMAAALAFARRNEVSGRFARTSPKRLRHELLRVELASQEFRHALATASRTLAAAGIVHTLIKADPRGDNVYGNFDLVVSPAAWDDAIGLLQPAAARVEMYPLEREKLLLHPPAGVSVHLHRSVSWFDVPVLAAEVLESRAVRSPDGSWLVPDAADALLITLAHCAFQTLELSLADMLCLRPLMQRPIIEEAASRAADGGWGDSFERVLRVARDLGAQLDAGQLTMLPRPLPVRTSYRVGAEHAGAAWHARRRRLALRELALRPALIAAKRRRVIAAQARGRLSRRAAAPR